MIGKSEKSKFKIVIEPIRIPARETSLITSWFFISLIITYSFYYV
ncbi:MAG: hypothetical protein ACRC9F_01830 [Metamycoplasmataceae bacterium]